MWLTSSERGSSLTLSSLNLPLSSSTTTSSELLSQFSTCSGWRWFVSIVGSLRDREVACSASDRQGSNFESCVWRTVSSQSSHHPQEVLLAQFSLYVHKSGLKPDSFHFEDGLKWVKKWKNCHVLVKQFHWNIHSKPASCRKIKSVFRDVKWCFNA